MPVIARLRGVAGKVAFVLAVTAIVLGAYYAPLIYKESRGKPLAFMGAVVKLELTDAHLVAVTPDLRILMQKCCPQPLSKPLTDFVSAWGWTYKDQMGAGIFYEKGNTRLLVTSRMFSRRYVVYHLDRTPDLARASCWVGSCGYGRRVGHDDGWPGRAARPIITPMQNWAGIFPRASQTAAACCAVAVAHLPTLVPPHMPTARVWKTLLD